MISAPVSILWLKCENSFQLRLLRHVFIFSPNETKKPRTLSKLSDTSAWERRKTKGKVAIQKMVVDLMELYLHRLKQKRPPYPRSPAMAEFASQFPYEPTPDQKQVPLSTLLPFSLTELYLS